MGGDSKLGKGSQLRELSVLKRRLLSLAIYYSNFTLGVSLNFFAPAVVDFERKFDTDVQQVAIIFTVNTVSYLVGALIYGILTKFVPRQAIVMTTLSLGAAAMFVVPHISEIMIFYVLGGVMGFGSGIYDSFQIAFILEIWRHEAAVYILAQHFSYSLGTIVPGVLLGPFLSDDKKNETTADASYFPVPPPSTSPRPPSADLTIPFSVAGGLLLISAVLQIYLYFKLKKYVTVTGDDVDHNIVTGPSADVNNQESSKQPTTEQNQFLTLLLLVGLTCCIIGFYQGLEMTTLSFIPTFAIYSEVDLSEPQAAQVLLATTLTFAGCRFLGIFVVQKVAPEYMFVGNFILITIGNIILLAFGQTNVAMLWTGCVILGAGLSTTFGGLFAFIEKHLDVTDRISAAVVVSGGLVAAIYPLVVGTAVEEYPSILTFVNFFSIFMCVTAFSVLYYLTMVRNKK